MIGRNPVRALLAVLPHLFAVGLTAQSVQPVGTLRLQEPPEGPIDQLVNASADSLGRILVVDGHVPRAILYDKLGKHVATFGSKGEGPGQFADAHVALFLPGNQIGVVATAKPPGLFIYDGGTGEFVRKIPLSLSNTARSVALLGRDVFIGQISFTNKATILRVNLDSSAETWIGSIPAHARPGGPVAGIFGGVYVALTLRDHLFIGYEPLSEVVLQPISRRASVSLRVPKAHRRGQPDDLEGSLREAMKSSYGRAFAQLSDLTGALYVGESMVALPFVDLSGTMPPLPEAVYVSMVDTEGQRACVDIALPFDENTIPAFIWSSGRLGVVQQVINAAGEAPATVSWYEVDMRSCKWQPMQVR